MAKRTAIKTTEPAVETVAEDPKRPANIFCQKELLAILGTAETMPATPFEDDKYEIWAVAQCDTYPSFKRADVLFELHTRDYWSDPPVLTRLNKWKGPMVMQDHYDEVPNSIRLPFEVIKSYRRYHRTSITYMLTLALHSFLTTGKPIHVGLFGVHMADVREEYAEQRPCCEYWLGRTEGAGMDIFLAGGALLQAPFLYGYEKYNPLTWKIRARLDGLANGQQVRENEEREAELKKHEQIGAVKEAEYWLRLAQRGELTLEGIQAEIEAAEKAAKEKK